MSEVDQVSRERVCYRHPDRPAPLSCSRCGRPICLDDAIDAPVGFLCPEDAQVPEAQRRAAARVQRMDRPPVTVTLVGLIAVVFVAQQVMPGLVRDFGLFGPAVEAGQWWRLVTSGFLHGGLLHVGFNGYLAWALGRMLEPATDSDRFLAVWLAGLFGGSAGALLLSYDALTIGASGAVFGLMGAAMVGLRSRGINPWNTQIGTLLILNLVFTFFGPNISVGGHLGGLLGGVVAGWFVFHHERGAPAGNAAWVVAAALGVAAWWIGITGFTLGIGL